jgi:hypothetical protein
MPDAAEFKNWHIDWHVDRGAHEARGASGSTDRSVRLAETQGLAGAE